MLLSGSDHYGVMSSALGRIEERFTLGQLDLNGLVTKTEDLPVSEHRAWIDRMAPTVVISPRPAERSGSTVASPSAQQVGHRGNHASPSAARRANLTANLLTRDLK